MQPYAKTALSVFSCVILLRDVMATSVYHSLIQDLNAREVVQGKVPPGDGMANVTVVVEFTPFDILDIDDAKQIVSVSTALGMSWTHPNLTWDSSDTGPYANLHTVEIDSSQIWTPSLLLMNGASEDRMVDMGSRVTLFSNGRTQLMYSPLMKFTCRMDLKVYPFDVQECGLYLVLVSSVPVLGRQAESAALSREALTGTFTVNGEWIIEDVVAVEIKSMIPGVSLEYRLMLRRKTTFYVISFIVPIVLTSYMNPLVFVIPSESGERVSYLVSIFVSNAVFVSFCTDQMPQGLNAVPLVVYLQLGIMAQSGLYILLVGYFMRRSNRHQHDVTDDATSDVIIAGDARGSKRRLSKNAVHPITGNTGSSKSDGTGKGRDWKVDMALFLVTSVLNTVFVVMFLSYLQK